MPVIKVEIDISCWCGHCGKGICHKAGTRGTDVTIDPCDCQIERIKELEDIETDLTDEIYKLKERIEELESQDNVR